MFAQIPQFPMYLVDENGTVVSMQGGIWKVLRPTLVKPGYLALTLYKDKKPHTKRVHSLVSSVFLGTQPKGMQVNHKNGVKTDNRLENLEYCTASQNTQHAHSTGLANAPQGERHGRAKLSNDDVVRLLQLKGSLSLSQAAHMFGISFQHVSKIWNGKKRKFG